MKNNKIALVTGASSGIGVAPAGAEESSMAQAQAGCKR